MSDIFIETSKIKFAKTKTPRNNTQLYMNQILEIFNTKQDISRMLLKGMSTG